MLPRRLQRLPERRDARGARVLLAGSLRTRLLGLAFLREMPFACALRLPECSSVHTFGMRFRIDMMFLDREGEVLRIERDVPPGRIVRCRGAAEVLEWRSPAVR